MYTVPHIVKIKIFQLIIVSSAFALIACDVYERDANGTVRIVSSSTEVDDEFECHLKLSEKLPNIPKIFSEFMYNKTWRYESFQWTCSESQKLYDELEEELSHNRSSYPCLTAIARNF